MAMEAMGHKFDENLICHDCGVDWGSHQQVSKAKECPVQPREPVDRDSPGAQLRDALLVFEFLGGQFGLKDLSQRYKLPYDTIYDITKEASDRLADAVVADTVAGMPDLEIIERHNLGTPHRLGRVLASRGMSKADRKRIAKRRRSDEQEMDL